MPITVNNFSKVELLVLSLMKYNLIFWWKSERRKKKIHFSSRFISFFFLYNHSCNEKNQLLWSDKLIGKSVDSFYAGLQKFLFRIERPLLNWIANLPTCCSFMLRNEAVVQLPTGRLSRDILVHDLTQPFFSLIFQ